MNFIDPSGQLPWSPYYLHRPMNLNPFSNWDIFDLLFITKIGEDGIHLSIDRGGFAFWLWLDGEKPTPQKVKDKFYNTQQKKFNHCLWKVFGADAKNSPYQTAANAPFLNAKFSQAQLGQMAGTPGHGAAAWNDPNAGPNGTVYIAREIFYSNGANSQNANLGSYAHELANILDAKQNPQGTTGGQPYEETYGDPHDPDDHDTGAQVEECMFGSLQYP